MEVNSAFDLKEIKSIFIKEYVDNGVRRMWEDNASSFIQKLKETRHMLTEDAEFVFKHAVKNENLSVDVSITINIPSTAPVYETFNKVVADSGSTLHVSKQLHTNKKKPIANLIVNNDDGLLTLETMEASASVGARGWMEICIKSKNCPPYKSDISKRLEEIFDLTLQVSSEIKELGFLSESDSIKSLVQCISSYTAIGTMCNIPIGIDGYECKDTKYEPYSYYNLEIHKP